ncbi:hypothetical protein PSTT_07028, partial [Puccinia striiformis]
IQPLLAGAEPPILADVAQKADYLFTTANYYGGAMGEVADLWLGNAANTLVETSLTLLAPEGMAHGRPHCCQSWPPCNPDLSNPSNKFKPKPIKTTPKPSKLSKESPPKLGKTMPKPSKTVSKLSTTTPKLSATTNLLDTKEQVLGQLLAHYRHTRELAACSCGYPCLPPDVQAARGRERG